MKSSGLSTWKIGFGQWTGYLLRGGFHHHTLAAVTYVCSADSTLLMKCPCVFVDVTKNSNLKYKKAAWKKRPFLESTTKFHALKIKTNKHKTVPVSLDLLFSWSSYQLQCLEDLLSPSFQSIKKREIISDLENSTLVTIRIEKFQKHTWVAESEWFYNNFQYTANRFGLSSLFSLKYEWKSIYPQDSYTYVNIHLHSNLHFLPFSRWLAIK